VQEENMAMAEYSFIQRSRLGRRLFVLDCTRLVVSGRRAGRAFEAIFPLSDVSPSHERVSGRYYVLVTFPLAIAATISILIRGLVARTVVPCGIILIPGCLLVGYFLFQAVKGISPVEIIRFRNRQGIVLFDVVKEASQAAEFEEFISEVLSKLGKR
jgi:hypothetical protein